MPAFVLADTKVALAAYRPMTQYIIRRLLQMIPITLGILTLVFSLIHLIPGDPDRLAGRFPRSIGFVRPSLLKVQITHPGVR